jgi:hypothetical protein
MAQPWILSWRALPIDKDWGMLNIPWSNTERIQLKISSFVLPTAETGAGNASAANATASR